MYGTLVAASEMALQAALGGIGKLGGGTAKAITRNLSKLDNVLSKVATSPIGKRLISGGSEFFEETLQSFLEPHIAKLVTGEEVSHDWEESFYNGLLGCVTGIALDGTDTTVDTTLGNNYDNSTNQGGIKYAAGQENAWLGAAEGQGGYRDDWGLSERDDVERRAQGVRDGTQGSRVFSEQGLSEGAGRPTVYDQGDRRSGTVVSYSDNFDRYDGSISVDNEGHTLTQEIADQLQDSTVLDASGRPMMVYHGTPNMDFANFKKGDTGFHFGTLDQARKRIRDKQAGQGRVFQGYAVIRKPIFSENDIGRWDAEPFSMYLVSKGLISDSEYAEIQSLLTGDSSHDKGYDAPAAVRLREILESKGYDGVIYSNFFEGDALSYMVFHDSQFIRTGISEYTSEGNGNTPFPQGELSHGESALTDQEILAQTVNSVDVNSLDPRLRQDVWDYRTHWQKLQTTQSLLQQELNKLQQLQQANGSAYEIQSTKSKIQKLNQILSREQRTLQSLEQKPSFQEILKTAQEQREKRIETAENSGIMEAEASALPNRFKKYVPSPKKRLEIIKEGIRLEKPIFTEDLLGDLAQGIKPYKNYYDVVLHGSAYGLEYFGENIDVETLCAIIAQRADYKKGTPIRLIFCNTGAKTDGVARYIADKLHVDILAPDKKAIVTKRINGEIIVYSGSEIGMHDGNFIVFGKDREMKRDE